MKLRIRIDLIGKKSAQITLVYVCEEALKNQHSIDNKIFMNDGITIWSFGDFIFDYRQIRLPERKKLIDKPYHTYEFKSENERYETFKKYYHLLNRWGLNTRLFPNTNTDIKKRVIIDNEYWTVI